MCVGKKDPLKVQDRPMGFNVTEYGKLTDTISDSTLQLPFKKWPFSNFGELSKQNYLQQSAMAIRIFPPFPTTIYVGLDFLYTLQPKQHIPPEADTRIQQP